MSEVLKEGFLSKRSTHAVVTNWRKRYFRLYPGQLQYFSNPEDSLPRRRIHLGLDTTVSQTNDQGYSNCFMIKQSPVSENFYVQTTNEAEKLAWADAIFQVARQAKDVLDASQINSSKLVGSPGSDSDASPVKQSIISSIESLGGKKIDPATPNHPDRLLLKLKIVEGKDLPSADLNGKSDPYCLIQAIDKNDKYLQQEEKKTKFITNTLNPVWNEDFVIGQRESLRNIDEIHIYVKDHDNFSKDETLGIVKIPLNMFKVSAASAKSSDPIDRWFQVYPIKVTDKRVNKTTKEFGEIHLKMSLTGSGLLQFLSASTKRRVVLKSSTESYDHSDNRLEIKILRAKNLIMSDFNKSSDPFCVVTLIGFDKKEIPGLKYKTEIKFRTQAPSWEDAHFIFGRKVNLDSVEFLKIQVMDHDKLDKNDPMGHLLLPLDEISNHKTILDWKPLSPDAEMADKITSCGEIQVQVCLIGENRGERARNEKTDREVNDAHQVKSLEQIELEEAQSEMLRAARSLDGARVACAVEGYQKRHAQFYGINGHIHVAHQHLLGAKRKTPEDVFQSRGDIEGHAILDVTVVRVEDMPKMDNITQNDPYAVVDVDPSVCLIERKKIVNHFQLQKIKPRTMFQSNVSNSDSVVSGETRKGMFSKRATAEVAAHRDKLRRNESRNETETSMKSSRPYLKVSIISGHGLISTDMNGYSDPYCTLFLIEKESLKAIDAEKKKTAIIQKTLNPVWDNESFLFGHHSDLNFVESLQIHIKDHNNIGRSTPLGRVEIPIRDLCHSSASTTSICSTAMKKRYKILPEPWMKQNQINLGELFIETEVVGDATVLAELLHRQNEEILSSGLSFASSFKGSEHNVLESKGTDGGYMEEEEEILQPGKLARTLTKYGNEVEWPGERFQFKLSYPGMLSQQAAAAQVKDEYFLRVQVTSGHNLTICDRNSYSDPFLTLIPVLSSGKLVQTEKQQSYTVYNSTCPSWPRQEFVFGKSFNIASMSHLAIHLYDRDSADTDLTKLKVLGDVDSDMIKLPRFLIHKVNSSGELIPNEKNSDPHDILLYDQRVFAFRKCGDGGRFFPARIRHYCPLPEDVYVVVFEDSINTISKVRRLFSVDQEGEISHVRSDKTVDIKLKDESKYLARIPCSNLTPVKEFHDLSLEKAVLSANNNLSKGHDLSGVFVEILGAQDLQPAIAKVTSLSNKTSIHPACIVTLLASKAGIDKRIPISSSSGEILDMASLKRSTSAKENVWQFQVPAELCDDSSTLNPKWHNVHEHSSPPAIQLGNQLLDCHSPQDGNETKSDVNICSLPAEILKCTSSIVIRIVDQGASTRPDIDHPCLGIVKLNLQSLQDGVEEKILKLLPIGNLPFDKYLGTIQLRVSVRSSDFSSTSKDENRDVQNAKNLHCQEVGLLNWYIHHEKLMEPVSSKEEVNIHLNNLEAAESLLVHSDLSRRQVLRNYLSPLENRQLDNLKNALCVIFRRILRINRELRLFDAYEELSHDEQLQFGEIHTVNSYSDSEWCNRQINEIPVSIRKDIVVGLEMELLNIANAPSPPHLPDADADLKQWLFLRKLRKECLSKVDDFLPLDRTSYMLSYTSCFTGKGLVSWIMRKPKVLFNDQWVQYACTETTDEDSLLNWGSADLKFNIDAMQAPGNRRHALVWLKALVDVGHLENVVEKRNFEDREDRYYRMQNMDAWLEGTDRIQNLSPLGLVKETDCLAIGNDIFCKKLTDHVAGVLGTKGSFLRLVNPKDSNNEGHKNSLLDSKAKLKAAESIVGANILWSWKYCILILEKRSLYIYENAVSKLPNLVIDLTGSHCIASYSDPNSMENTCFELYGGTLLSVTDSGQLVRCDDALLQDITKDASTGFRVVEFKAKNPQRWMQALSFAGINMKMEIKQKVIVHTLSSSILHQKCVDQGINFWPNDLEGSFQHLLNKIFGHNEKNIYDSEKQLKHMRSRIRNELKKRGSLGEQVTVHYGRGQRFNPPPSDPRKFVKGEEYKSRIIQVRTPFTDSKYQVKQVYSIDSAPLAMKKLLQLYKVNTVGDWTKLPGSLRDLFLLYDIEYHQKHETAIEEGVMRDAIRTIDGDLDPTKVMDCCVDLNLIFTPSDLESCVTRIASRLVGNSPMGFAKIPVQSVSKHRKLDWWFNLKPEVGMTKKKNLGQIRIKMEMVCNKKSIGSVKLPPPVEKIVSDKVNEQQLIPSTSLSNPFTKFLNNIKSPTPSPTKLAFQYRSMIKLAVLEGRKLISADFNNKSDPYVQVYLIDQNNNEQKTSAKTDIKMATLNPKWNNQEFSFGNAVSTQLNDKKALLIRVYDYDKISRDDPLGFLKLEFVKNDVGAIVDLKLHHADENGNEVESSLSLKSIESDMSTKEFISFERLLPDVKSGQSQKSTAKGNTPEDGLLGRLRIKVQLTQNENFVSTEKCATLVTKTNTSSGEQNKFGIELTLLSVVKSSPKLFTWSLMPCMNSGEVVHYDAKVEQLVHDNKCTLDQHLGKPCLLGQSYDISKVDYYEIVIHNIVDQTTYHGQLDCSFERAKYTPIDVESKSRKINLANSANKSDVVCLEVNLEFVGLNRIEQINRVLAETCRIAGIQDENLSVAGSGDEVYFFLWEVCRQLTLPGQKIAHMLLEEIRKMSVATKLHWKYTPKLLSLVLQHCFKKDRLHYAYALSLDTLLKRWSDILKDITEARSQLTGRLHGEGTPKIINALVSKCDWNGSESLPTKIGESMQLTENISIGQKVESLVLKELYAGDAVDINVQSTSCAKESIMHPAFVLKVGYKSESFDVICTPYHNGNSFVLPQVNIHGIVLVKEHAMEECLTENAIVWPRSGTVIQYDPELPFTPYEVKYSDDFEPQKEWVSKEFLLVVMNNVPKSSVFLQLDNNQLVHVSSSDSNQNELRPAKIYAINRNATYDIYYLDGNNEIEESVNRNRITPSFSDRRKVEGNVININSSSNNIQFDILLKNGDTSCNITRDCVRKANSYFYSATSESCARYLHRLFIGKRGKGDQEGMSAEVNELWGCNNIVQLYFQMNDPIIDVKWRDNLLTRGETTSILRDNDNCQFYHQYHGFTLGEKLGKFDLDHLQRIVKKQKDSKITFDSSCWCSITIAPEPYYLIRGLMFIRVGGSSKVFRAILQSLRKENDCFSDSIKHFLSNSAVNDTLSNPKPCRVQIKQLCLLYNNKQFVSCTENIGGSYDLKSSSDEIVSRVSIDNISIQVSFELPIYVSSNQSNLASGLLEARNRGETIISKLCCRKTIEKSFFSSNRFIGTMYEQDNVGNVEVSFHDSQGSADSAPVLEMILLPLEDIALDVKTKNSKSNIEVTQGLSFSINDVLEEAIFRQIVSPFYEAVVSDIQVEGEKSVAVKYSGKNSDSFPPSWVSSSDIQMDVVRVEVLRAKGLLSQGKKADPYAEVLLVTDDIPSNGQINQFGLQVNENGEILQDYKGRKYPKVTQTFCFSNTLDPNWEDNGKVSIFSFGQPMFDLKHARSLCVRLVDKKNKTSLGMAIIPLETISFSPSVMSFILRPESGERSLVCGSVTIRVCRIQEPAVGDIVLAKRFRVEAESWKICPIVLLNEVMELRKCSASRGRLSLLRNSLTRDPHLQEQVVKEVLSILRISNNVRCFEELNKQHYKPPRSNNNGSIKRVSDATISNAPSEGALKILETLVGNTLKMVTEASSYIPPLSPNRRTRSPWSADYTDPSKNIEEGGNYSMSCPLEIGADRVRLILFKLNGIYNSKLLPKLKEVYEADNNFNAFSIQKAQDLLQFFQQEVEDLDYNDAIVFDRFQKRLNVLKLRQILDYLLQASLRVTVMDEDKSSKDDCIGSAWIPLIDLIDQKPHDNFYILNLDRGTRRGLSNRGRVQVKSQITFSEVTIVEEAISILKQSKNRLIEEYNRARQRVNAAVVPAQRRRWNILLNYLEEIQDQANGKIHWERTPTLLDHVWDIFFSHKKNNSVISDYELSVQVQKYRNAVVNVHRRWINLQPKLEDLLKIQAASQIHAQHTPELLEIISTEIEGLDVLRKSAFSHVSAKWTTLETALEELVVMKERNKLHLGRAPQLLNIVTQKCSKGLNMKHADAVATIQFRWISLTKEDGPLNELRLMDSNGLHWRRTNELLLLLREQCEGLADIDAKALEVVTSRWKQLEEWLDELLEMLSVYKVDCQKTPFILGKLYLDSDAKVAGLDNSTHSPMDTERIEGLAEWYAAEEAKRELKRIPYHRISLDSQRNNWLAFSNMGRDSRLLITKEEMTYTYENVKIALEDRGVIPQTSRIIKGDAKKGQKWTNEVIDEINTYESYVENGIEFLNPHRIAEIYSVIEDVGKADILWKVKHCVNQNEELMVPSTYSELIYELKKRHISSTEMEDLLRGFSVILHKEKLKELGISVPENAGSTKIQSLLQKYKVPEVTLPRKLSDLQTELLKRNLDKKGEPVYTRGMQTNTKQISSLNLKSTNENTESDTLGIIDQHKEKLRKRLLMEAMRKRNSLIKTFPGESKVLSAEDIQEEELDMSGDYDTLVNRFQLHLIHEEYTKMLADFAFFDRCCRAFVGVKKDQVLTKEDMAIALYDLNPEYRLPIEAFTVHELQESASNGDIKLPSQAMLNLCPVGENADRMAYYAAISYTARIYQENTSFSRRYNASTDTVDDALNIDESTTSTPIPKNKDQFKIKYAVADWLLGSDDSPLLKDRRISNYHRQRLVWASAAITIRNRWFQKGLGWCDNNTTTYGTGIKVLMNELHRIDAANKMNMKKTSILLKDINDKCYNLRQRDSEKLHSVIDRYNNNLGWLEELVQHAERCINNRKLHTERTPELLHLLEQHCIVPIGLNDRHLEAYHVVTTQWLPHSKRIEELVQMHEEGTFSIHRTPELLNEMDYHTEGLAGTPEERNQDPLNEYRGPIKGTNSSTEPAVDREWIPLSPSKKRAAPPSPFKRKATWSLLGETDGSEYRKPSSVSTNTSWSPSKTIKEEGFTTLLKSPTKWLISSNQPISTSTNTSEKRRISPAKFFPQV